MVEILDKNTLKALSVETRQEIIKMLQKRPYTASELSKTLNKHVTTVSEHLNVLEKTNLVKKKESTNKWVYFELSDKGERLFKTKFYSWIVVLSISAIAFVSSIFYTFSKTQFAAHEMIRKTSLPLSGQDVSQISQPVTSITSAEPLSFLIFIIVIISIFGMIYSTARIRKENKEKIKLV